MAEAFKFIQASDLHLDRPMQGLSEIPTDLKRLVANAPYDAAQRIFDLALAERVDFVLLAGDILDIELGGCRPAAFLLSQFERLAEKNIQVFWCGGEVDHPERWPSAVDLPKNVVLFCSSIVEESLATRQGRTLATIVGSGYDPKRKSSADFIVDEQAAFPIGLTYGNFEPTALNAKHIRYWAVGGQHRSYCIDRPHETNPSWIVGSGTAQSRNPREIGACGCQLVSVDTAGVARIKFHAVDSIRWLPQAIEIAENATIDQLKTAFTERAMKLVHEHPDETLLVTWRVATTGEYHPRLRQSQQREEILQWLRREFGSSTAGGLWTVNVQMDPPAQLPAGWIEEDTILGDYLRAIHRYQADASLNLALHEYLPARLEDESLTTAARIVGDERQTVLAASALTGIEYLAAQREPATGLTRAA